MLLTSTVLEIRAGATAGLLSSAERDILFSCLWSPATMLFNGFFAALQLAPVAPTIPLRNIPARAMMLPLSV